MIKGFSHIGFDVKNMEEMLHFYCDILGMKEKFTLTYAQAHKQLVTEFHEELPETVQEFADHLLSRGNQKWLTYIEMAPMQFLEFFYQYEGKSTMPDYASAYGYQHFSLEVEDIHQMINHLKMNGIKPDSEIVLGVDGTFQCWLHDPDGNKFEIMEYTKKSLQIVGNMN